MAINLKRRQELVSRRKKSKEFCVYCGVEPATTRDHVIPQCLFIPPLPLNMVTVPTCKDCNTKKKSLDDPYLRDMLVFDNDCQHHPVVRQLLKGKAIRSARTNRSVVARGAVAAAQRGMQPRHSLGGLYLGHYYLADLDAVTINRILSTIVKGLHYKVLKQRLPDNCTFEIGRLDLLHIDELWAHWQRTTYNGPYQLGDVFWCAFMYVAEVPGATTWLLFFYSGICYSVATMPAGMTDSLLLEFNDHVTPGEGPSVKYKSKDDGVGRNV